MIKKIISSLALFGTASIATAEELKYQTMVVFGQCTETSGYEQMLSEQFGEQPILKGEAYIQIPNNDVTEIDIAKGMLVITTNYETSTYSVSIAFNDGTTCSLVNGDKFYPWDYIEPDKEKL